MAKRANAPLHGITVADFTRVLAGPLCTQMLADSGARVIKIEEPSRGDETRRWGPPFINGVSAYFLSVNRGKESIAIDLKTRDGLKIAKQLIRGADVVVDNFLPQQRTSLGLDGITRLNRRAIHLSISGFDPDTPEAQAPGYDVLAQAESGLMAITGPVDGEPMKVGVALADVLTAHHAFGAINAALFARERTGRGTRLEVSLFSSTLASLVNVAQSALLTGREARRFGNAHPSIVPYQLFRAADRTFAIGAGTDRHYIQLCNEVIGAPDLAEDPRFVTNELRVEHRADLVAALNDIFRTRRARHWLGRLRKAAIPSAAVQGPLEAMRSSAAGSLVQQAEHPVIGDYSFVSYPILSNGKRLTNFGAPPILGEQTDDLLGELGYASQEIARLRERGVISGTRG
jgi:crotonobetainyl-CoA:carnitine CoA-transferase CaiB-like acyl-CoA transferase